MSFPPHQELRSPQRSALALKILDSEPGSCTWYPEPSRSSRNPPDSGTALCKEKGNLPASHSRRLWVSALSSPGWERQRAAADVAETSHHLLPLNPVLSAAHTAPCSADEAREWAFLAREVGSMGLLSTNHSKTGAPETCNDPLDRWWEK